jgi:transmembrane sensor
MLFYMPDYELFTVEDFLFDPYFQDWIKNPTPANEFFWEEWLAHHTDRTADLKLARQLVLSLHIEQPIVSQGQIQEDVQRMLHRINRQETHNPFQRITRSFVSWRAVAAAVLLLTGIGGWWLNQSKRQFLSGAEQATSKQLLRSIQVKRNDTQQPVRVVLPDGSEVALSPKSSLTYPSVFADSSREVTLTGEAFFTIVKNPAHPFLVYADQIVTRVLGTSFRVRAYPEDCQLTVAVRTGKVAVYANTNHAGSHQTTLIDKRVISLTPNQQVEFSKVNAEFKKTLVEKPVVVNHSLKTSDFEFDETPVGTVLQRFEQAYGIAIIYDSDLMRDCALTASLADETMNEQLAIICKGIGATYEIIDGKIVIHSKGCQ